MEICLDTANRLAEARATNAYPVIVALVIYIGTVAIAFGRTSAVGGNSSSTYINIEAHSIAFTALYIWVVPTVIFSSIIGASQTERAIPRNLEHLITKIKDFSTTDLYRNYLTRLEDSDRVDDQFLRSYDYLKRLESFDNPYDFYMRKCHGGIYSWCAKRSAISYEVATRASSDLEAGDDLRNMRDLAISCHDRDVSTIWTSERCLKGPLQTLSKISSVFVSLPRIRPSSPSLPILLVFISFTTGAIISWEIPPGGINCRHYAEGTIFITWVINWTLEVPLPDRARFIVHFVKDTVATAITIGAVVATQVGIFNRCSCWCKGGKLVLPQIDGVAKVLVTRIETTYPGWAFACISVQLVIVPAILIWQFYPAVQVFVMHDTGKTHVEWLQKLRFRINWESCLRSYFSR